MQILFPSTLEELWTLFRQYPTGRIMAGGTDLLVRLRKSGDTPSTLFCLERLTELQQVKVEASTIIIGAGVTIQQLLAQQIIETRLPLLWEALAVFASPPVRHQATLGGNLCTASPAGDMLPPLYVLDAKVEIASEQSRRILPIADFILGPGSTALQPGELVTGVCIVLPPDNVQSHYYKVGKRQALAIAIVSLAVLLKTEEDKTVQSIKLAWGSVGKTVLTLPEVEEFLTGKVLTEAVLRQASKLASARAKPIDDVRACAAYRRQVSGNLLLRLLEITSRKI